MWQDVKEFNQGDIVYWADCNVQHHTVKYGMVYKQYHDSVSINMLELVETRRINGVPFAEFKTPTHWQKLPKGWTYDTQMFEITYDDIPELSELDIKKPETIKAAYDKGILVKATYSERFEAEFDTHLGWRIISRFDGEDMKKVLHTTVRADRCYRTYEEAKKVVDDWYTELQRQAALSDYDWSVEQIEYNINRTPELTDRERAALKNWLLHQPNVEDIETRVTGAGLQWKYWKNKTWNNIEVSDAIKLLEEGDIFQEYLDERELV